MMCRPSGVGGATADQSQHGGKGLSRIGTGWLGYDAARFGTKVAEGKMVLPKREKLRILSDSADALLANARHLSIGWTS